MEFEIRLQVLEVRILDLFDSGIEIKMRNRNDHELNKKKLSRIFASKRFLSRRKFASPQDMVGQFITFRFKSKRIPVHKVESLKGCIDYGSIHNTDLRIVLIKETEGYQFNHYHARSEKLHTVKRLLHLRSFGSGDGIHPIPTLDPFFDLKIRLSEWQYNQAAALEAGTMFGTRFSLD